ncbi:membrane protein [Actinoplanes lobatus]|uniref:Membrane protein n=1 Tax=Actinoplanes lobatus TaxID=113568 RepID=A0A7W7HEZ3_9ACTN|nr:MHYT domain-containing protein [Actinoplanes lobatus]MBB4748897.1 NO-binding membrane sensor protein with MHYT domain [Actinoplanes lobatus]GGN67971.1 membrane protein [Actinoplanes lobatus]GIE37195.1 membrane protein [Actinoplanes lobatus]
MADVHHFAYGVFNPIAAYMLAFLGSFLGLLCTGRARDARNRGRRNRWLVIAAFAIGGGGIWLMHFSAMLGFEVPASPVRYDLAMTLLSLAFAVLTVGIGLLVVGHGRRSVPKTVAAGLLTGTGVIAMHYTGMEGIRLPATIHYSLPLMVASALIAIAASTVALWFAVSVRGALKVTGAAAVMAVAVCGMHYTGMAAMSIELHPGAPASGGIRPLTMLVPIILITTATIVAVALSALQAMTEEEFTDGAGTPKRGVHAESPQPWSLKQSSMGAMRLTPAARAVVGNRNAGTARPSPGPRPSPRPAAAPSPAVPPATSGS